MNRVPDVPDAPASPPPAANAQRRARPWLVSLALLLGALSLAIAAVQQAAGPFEKPPPIEQAIAAKAKSILDRAREALTDRPPPPAAPPPVGRDLDQRLRAVSAGSAVLAIALALSGFARRENGRAAAGALVLATAALPWQIGLAVALAMAVVAWVSRVAARSAG